MQHLDLLLQYPYETLVTYLRTSKIIETYVCNIRFHTTSHYCCLPHERNVATGAPWLHTKPTCHCRPRSSRVGRPTTRAPRRTSTREGGGGVSRQPAKHGAITNRRAARLCMPVAEEFIYYALPARGLCHGVAEEATGEAATSGTRARRGRRRGQKEDGWPQRA
jgi:hypothetical protein